MLAASQMQFPLLLTVACVFAAHGASPVQRSAQTALNTVRAVAEIDWQTSPLDLDLRGMNGERYEFHCPSGKPLPSRVAGSGPYTDDSSICTAAVHAGVIHGKDGGNVTIEIRPGQARYSGSDSNYIKSGDYDGSWNGSFIVILAEPQITR
jgi:hypothetical protein